MEGLYLKSNFLKTLWLKTEKLVKIPIDFVFNNFFIIEK
jgi:hypothetical protein